MSTNAPNMHLNAWMGPADLSTVRLKRKAHSDSVATPPAKKIPDNVMHRGRRKDTSELTLDRKLMIVRWAEEQGLIRRQDNTEKYRKVFAKRTVDTEWLGDIKNRKVEKIREWANKSLEDDWVGFSNNEAMRTMFGHRNPLALFSRIPNEWALARGLKPRGRPAIADKFPQQIAALKDDLVQKHAHARDTKTGHGAITVDQETLYETWHSLVISSVIIVTFFPRFNAAFS